jgi:hypothetical protein
MRNLSFVRRQYEDNSKVELKYKSNKVFHDDRHMINFLNICRNCRFQVKKRESEIS